MSAYYAAGGPAQAAQEQTLAPVLVGFAGPAPQSRVTVLIRILMAIPQLIVVYLLGIAAMVVAIIGWFGALFTGRLPVFAADFLTGYLRWLARVYAYLLLLTDVYPPFTLDDADYPVRVTVMPGRLNRLAVFFRIFLLIPCWIVLALAAYGAFTIFQFVSWLIVLIAGRMPDTIHQGLAAVLRYQLRTLGFALMLTSAYPAGLFGDTTARGPWSPAGPPVGGPYGQPQPGYGDPQAYYGGQPGYGAQPAYGATAGYEAASGPSWELVLSGAARKLVVGFLVFGALIWIGTAVIDAAAVSNGASAANAASQVSADSTPVTNAIDNYSVNVKACKGQLSCVTKLDRNVAATLNTFATQLRAIPMPPQAVAANNTLATAVSNTANIYAKLGAATTPTQYISEASSAGLQQSLDQVNQAYENLGTALGQ